MLTPSQKAQILQRAGFAAPAMPANLSENLPGKTPVLVQWEAAVDALFVEYAAARAAKSLRDSEELRQLNLLRSLAQERRVEHA